MTRTCVACKEAITPGQGYRSEMSGDQHHSLFVCVGMLRERIAELEAAIRQGRRVLLPVRQSDGAVDFLRLEDGYAEEYETDNVLLAEGWEWMPFRVVDEKALDQ